MTNEEIKKKYKIEPIMKEMWVWDDDPEDACLSLVMYKSHKSYYPYTIIDKHGNTEFFKYACETNPNEPKKPKTGDMGYFWNDDKVSYAYGKLEGIDNLDPFPYLCEVFSWHQHFSHEKQPWMK
jgi:hypothetical protein